MAPAVTCLPQALLPDGGFPITSAVVGMYWTSGFSLLNFLMNSPLPNIPFVKVPPLNMVPSL